MQRTCADLPSLTLAGQLAGANLAYEASYECNDHHPPNNQVIAFSPELWTTVLLRRDMVSPGRLYAQTLLTPPRTDAI